jgi:mevalonate pyrophosphate decarboxylase
MKKQELKFDFIESEDPITYYKVVDSKELNMETKLIVASQMIDNHDIQNAKKLLDDVRKEQLNKIKTGIQRKRN